MQSKSAGVGMGLACKYLRGIRQKGRTSSQGRRVQEVEFGAQHPNDFAKNLTVGR